jgi:hypothetical protein
VSGINNDCPCSKDDTKTPKLACFGNKNVLVLKFSGDPAVICFKISIILFRYLYVPTIKEVIV